MGDPSPSSTFPPVPSLQLEIGTSYKARPPGSGIPEVAAVTSEDLHALKVKTPMVLCKPRGAQGPFSHGELVQQPGSQTQSRTAAW